jgi:anaphase-promoting complex subunit 2
VLVIFFSMSFHKFGGREKFQAFDSRPIQALLLQLNWMHIAEPALLRVLHSQIHKTMEATCGDDFSERYLEQLERWASSELLPWLDDLLQTSARDAESIRWREILSRHVIQEYGKWRIAQLFEIIKEYPESTPALEDLRACLDQTQNQHAPLLVASFRDVVAARLLHPGVNTSAILDIYVSTIKVNRSPQEMTGATEERDSLVAVCSHSHRHFEFWTHAACCSRH